MKEQKEEFDKILRDERADARLLYDEMQKLIACSGWSRLVELAEKLQRTREQTAVYYSEDELRETGTNRDRISGEAIGLKLLINMPKIILEVAEDLRQAPEEQDSDIQPGDLDDD
jgi:hypothetical protein